MIDIFADAPKKRTKGSKGAKAEAREKSKEVSSEIYDWDESDLNDPLSGGSDQQEFKWGDKNIVCMLPPLVRYNMVRPWITSVTHFIARQVKDALGMEIPSEIPPAQGCRKMISVDETCPWCDLYFKLIGSHSPQDRALAKALRGATYFHGNIIDLTEDQDDRVPQLTKFTTTIHKPLESAIKGGIKFCGHKKDRRMIPIRVTKEYKGKSDNFSYAVEIKSSKRVSIKQSWLDEAQDPRTMIATVPSVSDMFDWVALLTEASSDSDYDEEESLYDEAESVF